MTPLEQKEAIIKIRTALEGRADPLQIMLVEDEANDAEITIRRLKDVGLEVVWAKDTKEVQDILETNKPKLAFLDLKLSNTSGLSVLDFIKSFNPECKVVILTGMYNHDSMECKKALQEGALAVMLKPLTTEQINLIFGSP